jgi:histidinol-phosphatase (PHP family)
MHTNFSYDSKEELENYLNLNDKFIVTTEHFDTSNPVTKKDDIPDYAAYAKRIDELNQVYNNRLLKGVEVGYVKEDVARINAYLADKDFDVKLLSVHHNGTYDYMDEEVADMSPEQIIPEYYSSMLDAIEAIPSANVLAHFDYGVRVLPIDIDTFKKLAEPYLIPLFQKTIEHQLAFEVNAKSMWKYGNEVLYEYAIPLYLAQGGKLFSIGSDAHSVEDYESHFSDAIALLKKHGVNDVVVYQKGKAIRVEI